jgi:hypothetical protein
MGIMRYISVLFLLLNLLLAGCTTTPTISGLTWPCELTIDGCPPPPPPPPPPGDEIILSVEGSRIVNASIISSKKVTEDITSKESYQDCYTKKYDKNQDEKSLITSFFNTSTDSRIASVEFCETKKRPKTKTTFMHYLVKYEYEGNIYSYKTNQEPAKDEIRAKVIVVPEAYKGKISN